jgi:hypothetical protein
MMAHTIESTFKLRVECAAMVFTGCGKKKKKCCKAYKKGDRCKKCPKR